MVRIEHDVEARGIPRLLRLSNGEVEILVATEFGIRVLGYRRTLGPEVFGLLDAAQATSFSRPWRPRGGHRLWAAPEHPITTYWPDDAPVAVEPIASGVRLRQPIEPPTGIEKVIEIELAPASTRAVVRHRLVNRGERPTTLAPWALTVMAPGGQAILPNAPFVPHPVGLLPSRALVLWPYTHLGDPRFGLGPALTRVRQDAAHASPQKIGWRGEEGWLAYALGRELFVKRYRPVDGAHADFGCNVEIFVDGAMLELETLGPLATLEPGASVEHVEAWSLFGDVDLGGDDAVDAPALARLVAAPDRGA